MNSQFLLCYWVGYSLFFYVASHLLPDEGGLLPKVWGLSLQSRDVDCRPCPADAQLLPYLS